MQNGTILERGHPHATFWLYLQAAHSRMLPVFNPFPSTIWQDRALFPIYPSSHRVGACTRWIWVRTLFQKTKRYQVRVQGHMQKRTEKMRSGEDVLHNHDSKSLVTWTKGLKMGTWTLHSQKLHFIVLKPCWRGFGVSFLNAAL